MKDDKNLNHLGARFFHGKYFATDLPDGARYTNPTLENHSVVSNAACIETHFDHIQEIYCDLINGSEVAVGAIAWLTNRAVLKSLNMQRRVAIVVQKEDFLRCDNPRTAFPKRLSDLRMRYSKLKGIDHLEFSDTYPGVQEDSADYCDAVQHWLFNASGEFQGSGDPIRSLGFRSDKNRTSPKLHHKFLVLGDWSHGLIMHPNCVVTGSFNLTENATQSRENIVVIRDRKIALAYLSEWAQLWCISEPLDWSNPDPHHPLIDMQT